MYLEQSIGIILFVLGFSLVFQGELWNAMLVKMKGTAFFPMFGMLCLLIGAFLVMHLSWDSEPRNTILVIFGYLALIKSLFFLVLPSKWMEACFDWALKQHRWVVVEGSVYVILGLYLFIQ